MQPWQDQSKIGLLQRKLELILARSRISPNRRFSAISGPCHGSTRRSGGPIVAQHSYVASRSDSRSLRHLRKALQRKRCGCRGCDALSADKGRATYRPISGLSRGATAPKFHVATTTGGVSTAHLDWAP